MSSEEISIMRHIIAGVNGLLFSIGIYIIIYQARIRQQRLKRRLFILRDRLSKLNFEDGDSNHSVESDKIRREIEELEEILEDYYKNPRTVMNIGFGVLMCAIALLALLNIVNPSFNMFMT